MRLLRYLWAAPASLVGLLLLPLAAPWSGGRVRVVAGVLEIRGRALAWCLRNLIPIPGGAAAITFGHVVVGRDQHCLDTSRFHERVHVRQYERWGIFFYPAYLGASVWLLLKGRDAYRDNPFEREAYGAEEIAASEGLL